MLAWLIAGALGSLVFLPLCDLNFDCGCVWPGMGGASHCDIQVAGPPDCPWCDHLEWGALAALFAYAVGLAVTVAASARRGLPLTTLLGLLAIIGGTIAAGIVTSLLLGRPLLAGL